MRINIRFVTLYLVNRFLTVISLLFIIEPTIAENNEYSQISDKSEKDDLKLSIVD